MTRAISVGAALLCVLGLVVVPRAARAESASTRAVPVYVLSIWTDDADDQAESLTQALRWSVRQAAGWSLLESSQSFETLIIALKCPQRPDPACLLRIGDQLKADHYVWGTMDKKRVARGEVNAEVHMWARGKPDAMARETYSDSQKDPSSDSLRSIASGLFAKLTGAPAGGPSGERTVGPVQPAPSAESEHGFPVRTAVAYSVIAVGVGFLVASGIETALWIDDENRSTQDRKSVPNTVTDVCAETTDPHAVDACAKSKDAVNSSTLAWVFAGAGAVLAGTGIWLVATEHPSGEPHGGEMSAAQKPKIDLVPSLGARAGAVALRVTF